RITAASVAPAWWAGIWNDGAGADSLGVRVIVRRRAFNLVNVPVLIRVRDVDVGLTVRTLLHGTLLRGRERGGPPALFAHHLHFAGSAGASGLEFRGVFGDQLSRPGGVGPGVGPGFHAAARELVLG